MYFAKGIPLTLASAVIALRTSFLGMPQSLDNLRRPMVNFPVHPRADITPSIAPHVAPCFAISPGVGNSPSLTISPIAWYPAPVTPQPTILANGARYLLFDTSLINGAATAPPAALIGTILPAISIPAFMYPGALASFSSSQVPVAPPFRPSPNSFRDRYSPASATLSDTPIVAPDTKAVDSSSRAPGISLIV